MNGGTNLYVITANINTHPTGRTRRTLVRREYYVQHLQQTGIEYDG